MPKDKTGYVAEGVTSSMGQREPHRRLEMLAAKKKGRKSAVKKLAAEKPKE